MAISKKISELDVLTSPQDLTKLFPPLFAQDGSPLNIRMSMAEVLKSATQVAINSGTLTGSSSPALSITQTWNNAATTFTGALLNITDTASNAASKLLDLQVGGSSRVFVSKSAIITATTSSSNGATLAPTSLEILQGSFAPGVMIGVDFNNIHGSGNATRGLAVLGATGYFGFTSGNASASADVVLARDAADRLALRRSTNAQRFAVYRTWSAADNFERGVMSWYDSSTNDGVAGTTLRIGTEKGSVGGTARNVSIVADGSDRLIIKPDNDHVLIGNLRSSAVSTYDLGMSGVPWRTVFANKIALGASDMVAIEHQSNLIRVTNNSTGPGVFAIDNVQGTNFERLKAEWDTNVARFGTSKGGSGTARDFAIITDNTVRVTFAAAGGQTAADGHNMAFGTSTGTKIGTATGQKIGFWNATPVVQQVLATGAGATVDNVITLLQTLGLCKQS